MNRISQLKQEFLKLLKIADEQCDANGIPRGLFEDISTPEIERFIVVHKALIEMGQSEWVMNNIGV